MYLFSTYLTPFSKKIVVGNLIALETALFTEVVQNLNFEIYKNKPVIIKGCANKPIPATAYIQLIAKLQPIAKSIMFGEACSTVPLYKKKN